MKTKRVYATDCSGSLVEAITTYITSDVKTVCVLARVVIDKDYGNPSRHIEEGLKLFEIFQALYSDNEDGEVTVSLTIADYLVNV
jgi:hypothetical protein